MTKGCRRPGNVKVSMRDYLEKSWKICHKTWKATTATAIYLLNTNLECRKLPEGEAQLLYHLVTKLLFLCKMCLTRHRKHLYITEALRNYSE